MESGKKMCVLKRVPTTTTVREGFIKKLSSNERFQKLINITEWNLLKSKKKLNIFKNKIKLICK